MLHCFKCGSDLPDNMIYCLHCGERLEDEDEIDTVIRRKSPLLAKETVVVPTPRTKGRRASVSIAPQSKARPAAVAPTPEANARVKEKTTHGGTILAIIGGVVLFVGLIFWMRNTAYLPVDRPANYTATVTVPPPSQPVPMRTETTPPPNNNPVITERVDEPNCSVTANAQLHDRCGSADCDLDSSTVADTLNPGDRVLKLGQSRQSRRAYRWELVSTANRQLWIASNKLACGSGGVGIRIAPQNLSDDEAPNKVKPTQKPPKGATAICRDGTYSFSKISVGQCTSHGGVDKTLP